MKTFFVFLFFMVILIIGYDGKEDNHVLTIRSKRSHDLVRDLLQAIKTQVDAVGKLLNDVKHMKEEVQEASKISMRKAMQKVYRRLTKLEKQGRVFSNAILNTNNAVKGISKTVNGTEKRLSRVESKCHFIGNEVGKKKNKSDDDNLQQIAFTAHLNHFPITKERTVLVFKRLLTNIGGGYNVSDGTFYCPKDGLYIFSVTLEGRNRITVYGYLMKNNDHFAYIHEQLSGNGYPSASMTIPIKLAFGDRVWVKGMGIRYFPQCYFTGVYIG